jgi:2-hydroxycyclohexanecarboxyl-CoA dehydrogenase
MAEARRTALVTGGGSGMGRATSLRLARDGAAVGVLDVDDEGAESVAAEIRGAGGEALALVADVSDRGRIDQALARLREAFGGATILINNAGIENFCPIADLAEASWDRLMAVNLKGAYLMIQAVLPDMLEAGWGRIVNISGLGAQVGAPNMALYTATKGGVIAMTRSLAIELGPRGITVNSVSPGFIDTPMARRAIDANLFPIPYQDILATYPIPRLGSPDDIAAACAFFASEEAGYITAQLLGVNGGAAV